MSAQAVRGVLYVHSSPRALCSHVEWGIGRALQRAVHLPWIEQPVIPGSQRAEYEWEGEPGMGAAIASQLRGWEHLRFEVTEEASAGNDASRWMHTPDLGIFYAQIDAAGNTLVPEDRIRYAMEVAGGNASELQRELRLALGQNWDDELEVFRHAGDSSPVVWMHRVS
ncbi:DUF3145 domain-containing protein [Pseudoclavibacter chungangensis]|uniref:DUF3145 domain-containing protein n=1 Tax=Pseudoclavibacter chungangensis TaxID=587635 RepID=A0A7J5BNG2_9MICO|nr:DUF3145 domain-containing protein [Pseudoclavibacter chungangensis]KAB1653434.1 DUF3145 domain-containing protein [Pseudoclavibacter chungangensis]NYJ66370.1 hypothetical protein [Pseudoclavibacter chungangensis]